MGHLLMYGERVAALREEQMMSRRALAAEEGISAQTVRRVELELPVTFRTGRAVAEALDVRPPRRLGRVL
jgi:transcriptional regulator with XRE-family HTH domain